MVVKFELEQLGFKVIYVALGVVEIEASDFAAQENALRKKLQFLGFDLIGDKKSRTIEEIKTLIIDLVQNKNNELNVNLSAYLSRNLLQDYGTLSALFSAVEATTIEKYFINQKIEKVKELLTYNELTLSEIAIQLQYSSVAYLSNQFKKVTGFSPSYFKQLKNEKRRQIDEI